MAESSQGEDELRQSLLAVRDPLSAFIAARPAKRYCRRAERALGGLRVEWNDEASPKSCSSEMPDPWITQKKIRSALSGLHIFSTFSGFIQFWAPVQVGRRRLLTTSGQPFASSVSGSNYENYRSCCLKYQHDIYVNNFGVQKDPDPNIIRGLPGSAFVNGLPEFVLELGTHQIPKCPLVLAASECGLKASFVLPIFSDPSQSCCVGVLECCIEECCIEECDDSWRLFRGLNTVLSRHGLCLFDAEAHLSSKIKNICHLEDAKNEIDQALHAIIESHRVELAQAWIAYGDEYHDALSSSMKRMVGCRWIAHCTANSSQPCEMYLEHCHNIPFMNGNAMVCWAQGDDEDARCGWFAMAYFMLWNSIGGRF